MRYGSQDLNVDGTLPEVTWEGAQYVDRAILVGTPNGGAVDALVQLVDGKDMGQPFLPLYSSSLLGTFPSTYQLLPRNRHHRLVWDGAPDNPVGDLFDPELWKEMSWGLASPDEMDMLGALMPNITSPEELLGRAFDFQAMCLARADLFQRALDRPASPPKNLELFLVAGDAEGTPARVSVNSVTGELTILERGPGDGTVLRESALLDERADGDWQPQVRTPIQFKRVLFLPNSHLGLTKSLTFRDNVLYWLLEEPRKQFGNSVGN